MKEGYPPEVEEHLCAGSRETVTRHPVTRSTLMPMLHPVRSVDGFASPHGIVLYVDVLGLTHAEILAIVAFYNQHRRHPSDEYNIGVYMNALCAVMGGDGIWEALASALGVGSNETTPDGKTTLETLEYNVGCDYASVIMVNWELFDNQTPILAFRIVEDIRAGWDLHSTWDADKVHTLRETERVLAGFEDGYMSKGPGAGRASLKGLETTRECGWSAPKEVIK